MSIILCKCILMIAIVIVVAILYHSGNYFFFTMCQAVISSIISNKMFNQKHLRKKCSFPFSGNT